MANDTSTGYTSNWNVPNVSGIQVFNFDEKKFPFLSRLNGERIAQSDTFAMSVLEAGEAAAQRSITEAGTFTAPTAIAYEHTNEFNVLQFFHEKVNVGYAKQAYQNRLKVPETSTSGYGYTADPLSDAANPILQDQINMAESKINRDLEYQMLNGTYQLPTSASVAPQMRGIIAACTTNTVAASSATFTKALLDSLLKEMADTGSYFDRPVLFCNSFQKQKITSVYGYAPPDRNTSGLNIQYIETDFGMIEVRFCRHMPAGTILVADMQYVNLVKSIVPGKEGLYMPNGYILYEDLSKTGASEAAQMFGMLSIDYGSQKLHGTLTSLATS